MRGNTEISAQATGSIRYAVHNGSYILNFSGDVRVVFCTSIDEFLNTVLSDKNLTGVLIDLTAASNIDSTTLGMLAKIAVKVREKLSTRPIIVSNNPDINRILATTGFKKIFYILDRAPIFIESRKSSENLEQAEQESKLALEDMFKGIPQINSSEAEICEKVLEAHRILMELNDTNKETFKPVVDELEKEQEKLQKLSNKPAKSTFNHH